MQTHLVLGPYLNQFNDRSNLLLASKTCITESKYCNIPVFSYPLDDKSIWLESINYSRNIYEELINIIWPSLNELHSSTETKKYWEYLGGWHLRFLSDIISEKLYLYRAIKNRYPQIIALTLPTEYFIQPSSSLQFISLVRKDKLFNWQLATLLWKIISTNHEDCYLPESDHRKKDLILANQNITSEPIYISSLTTKIISFIRKQLPLPPIVLYKTLFNRQSIAYLYLTSFAKIGPLSLAHPPTLSSNYDSELRARFLDICYSKSSEYLRPYLDLTISIFPSVCLENWITFSCYAKAQIKNKKAPRVIITGLGTLVDTAFSAWLAECSKYNTKVVGMQHGGGYGEHLFSTSEMYEIQSSSSFLSWGWSDSYTSKVIPYLAARFQFKSKKKQYKRPKQESNLILWVGTSDSRYCYQLAPRPISSQFIEYFDEQLNFAREISKFSQKIIFRPYPEDLEWGPFSRDSDISKYVDVDPSPSRSDFTKSLGSASLILVDHIGSTTFLQALISGKPCIVVKLSQYAEYRPRVNCLYDELQSAGIYFDHWHRLIEAFPSIVNNIEKWWSNPARQKVIKKFIAEFAFTSGTIADVRNPLLNLCETKRHARVIP